MFKKCLAVGLAALAMSWPVSFAQSGGQLVEAIEPERQRRPVRRVSVASLPAKYRNRRKAGKPKRRPNRLHISRRVRRRHRKAA